MTEPTTRDRMVSTALRLFRERGYPATSWRRLVEEAGTPWGSAYHHFPGGKEELGVAAVELGTQLVNRTVRRAFERHHDPADAVRWWYRKAGEVLAVGDFRSGCPLATIALEMAHASPALTAACEHAFTSWQEQAAALLRERGFPPERATDLAVAVITNLEGALLLARVRRSLDPLHRAAEHVAVLVVAARAGN
ncbi:TetR/AcrR family transcriptional regulator, lmrAB and yxaGH operons repressor [Amycolatopsis arida]|uniref:TetR/AcrR family transcriptional regulator, lmrAB and yxaGH operons repressor n=1 Tax=Amycolatopsis arida TaxID=587909 RepID=A0A1I5XHR9_9PSEU|nr:TetR/AcrR family transcriptional regulator [Amycolatopsis arida]TDX97441.1 TetR/AcrR family transcriptional repressor of lmrAB and yxaGH operons [Amycolatopsis arida]SFQ31519.1 TetR/AcrR family transcriptional regulator, lmrAB and yxaGH operons repressor [Amycolatopsis arida]